MKILRLCVLAALAAAVPVFAQCSPNKDNCANFTFSAPSSVPGAYYPIPAGATTINVQLASDSVTGNYTAQIQTAAAVSGGAMTSPTNCGSSVTISTTAGTVTATCTASSSQPWAYVAVVLTGGTGSGHGTIAFTSSLVGGANVVGGSAASFTSPASGQVPCWYGQTLTNCFQPTGAIDLLSFTKSDASSLLTVAMPSVKATNATLASTFYLYKDYGASFFDGSAILQGRVECTADTGGTSAVLVGGMSTAINPLSASGNNLSVQVNCDSAPHVAFFLDEYNSGSSNQRTGPSALAANTWWYWVLVRTGGTAQLFVYSDAAHQSLVGSTLALTLLQNVNYEYLYAISGFNSAGTNTATFVADQLSIVRQ